MYPNWKKGLKVTVIAGSIAAILFFASVYSASRGHGLHGCVKWPPNPWCYGAFWRTAAAIFLFVGSFFGLLAAFRPDFRSKK